MTVSLFVFRYCIDWNDVFMHISPYSLSFIGIACGLALSVIGAAWLRVRFPPHL